MSFFQLAESADEHSWAVTVPPKQFANQSDIWNFSEGNRLNIQGRIQLQSQPSNERDFALTGFSIPIITDRFRNVLESVCPDEVQFLPTTEDDVWILNIAVALHCIDFEKSTIQICMNKGRAFRHRFGKPEMISKLVIRKSNLNACNIFRVKDWRPAIVVSSNLKTAIEHAHLRGMCFFEV